MCDRCYHIDCVKIPKIDITNHILDLHAIIDSAEGMDVKLTGTKLIDAWYKKGPSNLRLPNIEVPTMDRYWAEQIVAFMILEKYLKEDFHFTAYNTISYIRKGPIVPKKESDVLFHGARVLKLPEIDVVWGNETVFDGNGSSRNDDSVAKTPTLNRSQGEKRRMNTPKEGSAKKSKTKPSESSKSVKRASVSSTSTPKSSKTSTKEPASTSSTKKPPTKESAVIDMSKKLLERSEPVEKSVKAELISAKTVSDDVIFVPESQNVIEILDED